MFDLRLAFANGNRILENFVKHLTWHDGDPILVGDNPILWLHGNSATADGRLPFADLRERAGAWADMTRKHRELKRDDLFDIPHSRVEDGTFDSPALGARAHQAAHENDVGISAS